MKFHSTINKAKKNQPSSWAKTALGIAENNGRSWKKDKENISDWWNCSQLANFVKSSGWTWQTLPKTVFCKVIAVLKTFSFHIKCLLFMTFFVWYLASVWQGQLMTSLETSTNALYTANVLVTTIKALEKNNTFL